MGSFDTSLGEVEALLTGFSTEIDDGEIALIVRVQGSLQERVTAQKLLEQRGFFRYGSACQCPLGELALIEGHIGMNAA